MIAGGDHHSFEIIFHQYKHRIYNIAYKLTTSQEVSEDIVQDIFMQIWLKRSHLAEVQHFKAYLFTVARNYITRYLKQTSRLNITTDTDNTGLQQAVHSVIPADQILTDKEYTQLLQQAILRLPPQQAEVYRLSKQEGLKREAVALKMGISPETVKVHLALAMRSIRSFCLSRIGLPVLIYLFMQG
ncbi:MAG TPA: RNA polymerase sigma-70 factor [Chitinophaga sp.]|nr:RNA polymerase sigma-70 factor [Chitinophaga sp.]